MNGLQLRFLRCLHDAGAPCVVIGGFAIRALGIDRTTTDLDVVTSTEHAVQTHAGLALFSTQLGELLTPEQLALPKKRIEIPSQHGKEVDVLTSVGNLRFADLYARRFDVHTKDVDVPFASAADQLAIKRISLASAEKDIAVGVAPEELPRAEAARNKDRADIMLLELHIRRS